MKLQIGVRVESELWGAYRVVCGREKLRAARPIEEFLRVVVDSDSALSVLRVMREAVRMRVEGCEAFARVLLDWYKHGKFWYGTAGDEDVSVESMLLDALKSVRDADLRRQIEETLVERQRELYRKNMEAKKG